MSETVEHSPSLREAIEAAYTTGEGTNSPAEPAAPAPEAEAPAAAGPARGPDGKFAPREAAGAVGAAPSEPTAPDGYDPDLWAQLTPEARAKTAEWAGKQRETLAEREARLKGFEPVERALATRREALAAQYGSAEGAVEQLFQLSDWAARDPVAFIRHIAQQRGLTPQQVFGEMQQQAAQQGQQPQQQDPAQFVSQIVQQEMQRARDDAAFTAFEADASLEHRNDPQIRQIMRGMLLADVAPNYHQAYGMAVQAHPEFGPKQLAAKAEQAAKAETERRAKDAVAKASAAVSVTGAPGPTRPSDAPANLSLRDELTRQAEAATSGRV